MFTMPLSDVTMMARRTINAAFLGQFMVDRIRMKHNINHTRPNASHCMTHFTPRSGNLKLKEIQFIAPLLHDARLFSWYTLHKHYAEFFSKT